MKPSKDFKELFWDETFLQVQFSQRNKELYYKNVRLSVKDHNGDD